MAPANVELVKRGIDDVEAFWGTRTSSGTYVAGPCPPDLDPVYVGREAVIEGSRRYWGTWDDYRVEAEELLEMGTSVVVIVRERGRGKASGVPFEQLHPQVWTFSEGRITRWASFATRAEALEAARLSA